jgi:hypothetical protein
MVEKPMKSMIRLVVSGFVLFWSHTALSQIISPCPCEITWDSTIQISHTPPFSASPRVFFTGDHGSILWSDANAGGGALSSYSSDGGLTWSPDTMLASGELINWPLAMFAYDSLNVYMAADTFDAYRTQFMVSHNGGESWGPLEHLGLGWPKAIAADGGTVVIAYRTGGNTVYIRRSTDRGSSWTDLGAAYNGDSRGLAATDFGVHSIWQDGTGFGLELFYRRSTDGGLSWSPEMQASSFDGENSQNPSIAANKSGNVYLVWNDQKYGGFFGGTILLRRSEDNGATWGTEQIISQYETAFYPRIFAKGSIVAVTWDNDDEDLGAILLRISFDFGETWTAMIETSPVSEMGGTSDVWIQDSTIHIVWGSDKVSNSEIYYKQGHFSISDQPPVVYAESTHVQPDGSIHLVALARDCSILTGSNGAESVALT